MPAEEDGALPGMESIFGDGWDTVDIEAHGFIVGLLLVWLLGCCCPRCRRRVNDGDGFLTRTAKRCCWCCCCCCCCQRRGKPEELQIKVHALLTRKSTSTAYVSLVFGGLLGAHHFYLGNVITALSYAFTLGWFGLGVLYDLWRMPWLVQKANRRCHPNALESPGMGAGTLLLRVAVKVVVVYAVTFFGVFRGPVALSELLEWELPHGAVQSNPYDVLGIPRGSNESEAKRAYRELAKQWHPDKCRHFHSADECQNSEETMQRLTLAHEATKKGTFSASNFEVLFQQWSFVFTKLGEAMREGAVVFGEPLMKEFAKKVVPEDIIPPQFYTDEPPPGKDKKKKKKKKKKFTDLEEEILRAQKQT